MGEKITITYTDQWGHKRSYQVPAVRMRDGLHPADQVEVSSSVWSHDYLLRYYKDHPDQTPTKDLQTELEVLAALEGLDQYWATSEMGRRGATSVFRRFVELSERHTAVAYGVQDAFGLTEEERARARENRDDIEAGRRESPLGLGSIEWMSAATGLLTLDVLDNLGNKPGVVSLIRDRIETSNIDPQYRGPAKAMLGELDKERGNRPLMDYARQRSERIIPGWQLSLVAPACDFLAKLLSDDIILPQARRETAVAVINSTNPTSGVV